MPLICIEDIEALRKATEEWDDASLRLRQALKPFHEQVPELFPTRFEELSIKDCSAIAHTLIKLEKIFLGGAKWSKGTAVSAQPAEMPKAKRPPRDEIS